MEATTAKPETKARVDVYQIVTDKIIEQLNKGTVPWHKPWTTGGVPKNLVSKRCYSGINLMLLSVEGYEHNLFLTFNQLHELGGKVKKGEHGHQVVHWKKVEPKDGPQNGEAQAEQKKTSILRYYYVFNIAQCENIPKQYLPDARETEEMLSCESIVKEMPKCPVIKHKEQEAYYAPAEDYINMPKKRSFKTDAAYYSTLFHELVHSTGHSTRLDRKSVSDMAETGADTYSQEELVAEIGTCYLQSFAGITGEFRQSAAYIQGWLSRLKNDKQFIFTASKEAQRAVNYILSVKTDAHATEDAEE